MRRTKKTGFTFVELIIVVTIIMLLSVVGIVSFQGANQKARDGRRQADLEKIRIALEAYRQVNGRYPTADGNNQPQGLTPTYMQSLPTDPKDNSFYVYTPGASAYTYQLYARMENASSTNGTFGTTCGGASCNFRLLNP